MWPFGSSISADERVLTWIKGRGVSWGADIADGLSMGSGTLYPALQRLEECGEIASRWEGDGPLVPGLPRRRLYHVPFRKALRDAKDALALFHGKSETTP